MNEEELEEIRKEVLELSINNEIGKTSLQDAHLIIRRIFQLNTEIDKLGSNKNDDYFLFVDICYTYYRLREAYL